MAFRQIDIGPLHAIRKVAAQDLPNLVVIAGPNGCGKSSLLYRLQTQQDTQAEPGTDVIYVGPHVRGGRERLVARPSSVTP